MGVHATITLQHSSTTTVKCVILYNNLLRYHISEQIQRCSLLVDQHRSQAGSLKWRSDDCGPTWWWTIRQAPASRQKMFVKTSSPAGSASVPTTNAARPCTNARAPTDETMKPGWPAEG